MSAEKAAALDYRATYAGPEFARWARAEGLIEPEAFLADAFLDPHASTLEAGTGGGRILRALSRRGFTDLQGFDGVPSLLEEARRQDLEGKIQFRLGDARELPYESSSFDQLIYLQQILCFIADSEGRARATCEARRVLRPGGAALFSFLLWESRVRSVACSFAIAYLRALRWVSRRAVSPQSMPWLSRQGRFNRSALLDRPPRVYWFRCAEALELLTFAGFRIEGAGAMATIPRRFPRTHAASSIARSAGAWFARWARIGSRRMVTTATAALCAAMAPSRIRNPNLRVS